MLSTQYASSIEKRRQTHRRQQSLEVPILANPLPANPRHARNQRHQHRRGLSLDQSLTALPQSPGQYLRPLTQDPNIPQDTRQYSTTPTVSIPQDHHPQDTQHLLQETQLHKPSQPGNTALEFTQHLQRQFNGLVSPAVSLLNAEEAKQQLREHINWFQATYGESTPSLTISTASDRHALQPTLTQYPLSPSSQSTVNLPGDACQYQQANCTHSHSHTVPNTPRHRVDGVASPAFAGAKHLRSHSFQYDAAPLSSAPLGDIFDPNSFGLQAIDYNSLDSFAADQSYASSAYSSSIADPMSPGGQYNTGVMPTVPEEPAMAFGESLLGDHDGMITVGAGFADDSQGSDQLHAPQPYSPRQAALLALGDINASIEETGVSADQVNQYMSDQNAVDSKWTCLYPECGKRFGRKENIRAHVQTHLGDRQFKCNDCGKCFVRQHDLKRHAKIHSGMKPNVCPCGMSFARQDALTRHRQRGTCFGVLPGFEKNEEEKKKRGRPRKERPDMESRMDKATRARRMDAAAAAISSPSLASNNLMAAISASAECGYTSGSSDSGGSDHSSPMTPAHSSDVDEILFSDFVAGGAEAESASFEGAWLVDTPPTSPASYHTLPKTIAPTMLSNHGSPAGSSPASLDDVELALLAWRGEESQGLVF